MLTVIHISTDYPDVIEPAKTKAILNLVEATADQFDHQVYSLNRVHLAPHRALARWVGDDFARGFHHKALAGNISCWEYEAMPFGLFLQSVLQALGDAIADDIIARKLQPRLIHGHKLSMEGIVVQRVAERLNVPFGLSLQGNTDRRILGVRRDLRKLYRKIYNEAAVVFPFAPWIKDHCDGMLGPSDAQSIILPCMTVNDHMMAPSEAGFRAISAFHLKYWHMKNADRLIAAAGRIGKKHPDFVLEIAGGGTSDHETALTRIISRKAPDHARLLGSIDGSAIQQWMNSGSVFVMPSRRETFGLVFVEALMAGCPVIYPENAAIEGYFDGFSFARAVRADDIAAMAAMMEDMMTNERVLKQELAEWQNSDHAHKFRRDHIARAFANGIATACAADSRE